jgi:hypothetical protein
MKKNSYGGDGMPIVRKRHGDNGKGQVRISKSSKF